jgi:hypothetical protein
MKKTPSILASLLCLLVLGLALPFPALAKNAAPPPQNNRPHVLVRNYWTNEGPMTYGLEFNLVVRLKNDTNATAFRAQISFNSAEVTPRKTGGVLLVGDMVGLAVATVSQPMTVTSFLYGKKNATINGVLSYYDGDGNQYTENLVFLLPVAEIGGGYYKTPTPTPIKRSQLVITEYTTDVDTLQPGMMFTLTMNVKNVGNSPAKGVTMIVGGGSTSSGDSTPVPGGISGGSGEFTNFAPVGASNVQALGDFAEGIQIEASQKLIVNVSTSPGAYPMKVTFTYLDDAGNVINDEQVITLLVYNLPTVDVNFYRDLGPLYAGQPATLPIQVVNLGKRSSVLGSIKIETTGGTLENATGLVGALDVGGFFTLDTTLYPDAAGPLDLLITINYTDDFNQPRTITKTIQLEVQEALEDMPLDPAQPGEFSPEEIPAPVAETFWQKVWRFILGLFGLDSSTPAPGGGVPDFPGEEIPAGSAAPVKAP